MKFPEFAIKNYVLSVLVALVIMIVLVVGYGLSTASKVTKIDELWKDYNQSATAAAKLLSSIQAEFGYGGFIHNFKNYVLRRDEEYIERARQNLKKIYKYIGEYENLALTLGEHEALVGLRGVVDNYNNKLNKAMKLHKQGVTTEKLDKMVKVDDLPALIAIRRLVDASQYRSTNKELETDILLEHTLSYISWGLLIVPIFISAGFFIIFLVKKISEYHKESIAAKNELSVLVESAPDAILSTNKNGQIIQANKQAESLFGYSHGELIGMSVDELLPEKLRENHAKYREKFIRGRQSRPRELIGKLVAQTKEGKEIPVEISLNTVDSKGKAIAIAIVRDLTDRIRAEDAEKSNQAKTEFLSHMSHELRTPLNAILGFTQVMQIDQEQLDDEQKENLDYIFLAAKSMSGLVDDVLDFAKIKEEKLSIRHQNVNVKNVILDAVNLMKGHAEGRNITINVNIRDDNIVARGDEKRLRQVLVNLLKNAIIYNKMNGSIEVGCGADAKDDEHIYLFVSDSGPGITEENIARIFEPFDRAGMEKDEESGTGLGLAISKFLVENMDGEILVESESGLGSRFTVKLDKGNAENSSGVMNASSDKVVFLKPPNKEDKRVVLYIEDNRLNIALMKKIAKKRNDIDLLVANSGQAGIELALSKKPDLIILDFRLPDMDGDSVLQKFKSHEVLYAIPVVILSAEVIPGNISDMVLDDVKEYLAKPLEIDELNRVIEQYT